MFVVRLRLQRYMRRSSIQCLWAVQRPAYTEYLVDIRTPSWNVVDSNYSPRQRTNLLTYLLTYLLIYSHSLFSFSLFFSQ